MNSVSAYLDSSLRTSKIRIEWSPFEWSEVWQSQRLRNSRRVALIKPRQTAESALVINKIIECWLYTHAKRNPIGLSYFADLEYTTQFFNSFRFQGCGVKLRVLRKFWVWVIRVANIWFDFGFSGNDICSNSDANRLCIHFTVLCLNIFVI